MNGGIMMYDKAEVIGIELVVDGETIAEWSANGEENGMVNGEIKWNTGEKQGITSSF